MATAVQVNTGQFRHVTTFDIRPQIMGQALDFTSSDIFSRQNCIFSLLVPRSFKPAALLSEATEYFLIHLRQNSWVGLNSWVQKTPDFSTMHALQLMDASDRLQSQQRVYSISRHFRQIKSTGAKVVKALKLGKNTLWVQIQPNNTRYKQDFSIVMQLTLRQIC